MTKGCCCCCCCPCHETKPPSRDRCCGSSTSEASLPKGHSTQSYCNYSEVSEDSHIPLASRPSPPDFSSPPGSSTGSCSTCALNVCGGVARQHHACRCSLCCSCSCSAAPASHLDSLVQCHPFLSYLPIVDERTDEERLADAITASGYQGKYVVNKYIRH